jgi:hypothetical protein
MEGGCRDDEWVFTRQLQSAMELPLQEQGLGLALSKDPAHELNDQKVRSTPFKIKMNSNEQN